MANLVRATELLDELAKQFENGSRGWVLCQQLRVVLCDDDLVRAGEAPVALLAGLRAYRDVHQQWVVHLEHCAGCYATLSREEAYRLACDIIELFQFPAASAPTADIPQFNSADDYRKWRDAALSSSSPAHSKETP